MRGNQVTNDVIAVIDRYEESEQEIEEEVDILLSSDIVAAQMSTKLITFSRAQSGWLFRSDKSEVVGDFRADFYTTHGLQLESRKRREHLSEEDLVKNKAIMDSIAKGNVMNEVEQARRPSLAPPQKRDVTWREYVEAAAGKAPVLGRNQLTKHNSKSFKACVAMSEDFPMTVTTLLDVLEVIAPFKQFGKLRDFMQTKLPAGFPVKVEIPVFPTVTAKVTFQQFAWDDKIQAEKFVIPRGNGRLLLS